MYVHLYICVSWIYYICMYICIYIIDILYMCIYIHTYIHIYVFTHIYIYIHIHTYIYLSIYMFANVYRYIHIFIYIHTGIYIHTYIYLRREVVTSSVLFWRCALLFWLRTYNRNTWRYNRKTRMHVYMQLYGVATISRLLEIIGLFCRISSLLHGSFAKETYHFKEPTNRSHPIFGSVCSRCGCVHIMKRYVCVQKHMYSCVHTCLFTCQVLYSGRVCSCCACEHITEIYTCFHAETHVCMCTHIHVYIVIFGFVASVFGQWKHTRQWWKLIYVHMSTALIWRSLRVWTYVAAVCAQQKHTYVSWNTHMHVYFYTRAHVNGYFVNVWSSCGCVCPNRSLDENTLDVRKRATLSRKLIARSFAQTPFFWRDSSVCIYIHICTYTYLYVYLYVYIYIYI